MLNVVLDITAGFKEEWSTTFLASKNLRKSKIIYDEKLFQSFPWFKRS